MEYEKFRCPWCLSFGEYVRYHDEEWGVPANSDEVHFEFLVLESAQAGLSWSTILKKRDGYRKAFADFNYKVIADFQEAHIKELMQDSGIIRNELKIKAAINNARMFMDVQSIYGSFNTYIWDFMGGKPIQNHWEHMEQIPATTEVSDKLTKDLKRKGFKFLGSTTLYAHMQATGLVNDHLTSCFRFQEVQKLAI